MAPRAFSTAFLPYAGQVSRTVRDGMGLPKGLVRRGATALAPNWNPHHIEPSLQFELLQLFARLNVTLTWRFGAGCIQIRQRVPHFDIENVIGKGTVQVYLR
jgi:hypothetical protein